MLRLLKKISIVDVLVLMAILMILSSIVLPHFASNGRAQVAQPAPVSVHSNARH